MLNYARLLPLVLFTLTSAASMAAPLSLYTELDQSYKRSEAQKVRVIPKGNAGMAEIPEVARLRVYSRAVLNGEWEALLKSGRETEFALTLGKNKIPKISNFRPGKSKRTACNPLIFSHGKTRRIRSKTACTHVRHLRSRPFTSAGITR